MTDRPGLFAAGATAMIAVLLSCQPDHTIGLSREPSRVLASGPAANQGQEKQCDAVAVSPSGVTIAAGQTLQLTAQPLSDNGKELKKATVEWSSQNPSVAAVSSFGLLSGVVPGTATIRATCAEASGFGEAIVVVQ